MKELKRKLPVIPAGFEDPKLPQTTFSHSQYSLFKKCGKAYAFRYCEGMKLQPRGAMFKGSMVHKGAEFSLTSVLETKAAPSLEEARAFVADNFEAEKATVASWDDDENDGVAKDITLRAYGAYHQHGLPKMHPTQVEEGFAIHFGGVPTIGYVDLIDRVKEFDDAGDPGRLVLSDLKYSSASWSQDEADREPQFTLYAKATGVLDIRVDNVVSLKKGPEFKQRSSTRTPTQIAVLEEDYADTADLIRKGVFPMAPIDSWQCTEKWCGYWTMCRGRKR